MSGCQTHRYPGNVVNPTNVGAIFRSAAALGIDAVLLTAGCSDPLYRRAARVSMGTVFQVPWTFLGTEDWADRTMAQLRGMGYRTAAMALRKTACHRMPGYYMKRKSLQLFWGRKGKAWQRTLSQTVITRSASLWQEVWIP